MYRQKPADAYTNKETSCEFVRFMFESSAETVPKVSVLLKPKRLNHRSRAINRISGQAAHRETLERQAPAWLFSRAAGVRRKPILLTVPM